MRRRLLLELRMTLQASRIAIHARCQLIGHVFITVHRMTGETGKLVALEAGRGHHVIQFAARNAYATVGPESIPKKTGAFCT